MNTIHSILLLAFPNVGEQDLIVPWELLKAVAWSRGQKGGRLDVVLGAFPDGMLHDGALHDGLIPTQMGTAIRTDRTVTPDDRYDLVYVPGGIGAGALSKDEKVLEFLRAHQREGRWLAGNCAGMAVLHRAGVLQDARITSAATLARRLPAEGSPIVTPRRAWMIDADKRIFSAGGAATVHPSTIALVAHLFGEDAGRELGSGWDTRPLYGDVLFSSEGPVMTDNEAVKTQLQDYWEGVFLPD